MAGSVWAVAGGGREETRGYLQKTQAFPAHSLPLNEESRNPEEEMDWTDALPLHHLHRPCPPSNVYLFVSSEMASPHRLSSRTQCPRIG